MIYLVAAGDTLSGIASAHGESLPAIEAANPNITDPNVLTVGEQVIVLGGSSSSAPSSSSSTPSSSNVGAGGASSGSSSSLSDVPGVPSGFAACVAFRESTNGQGSSNVYGIIPSSGYNGYGASLAQQKQMFAALYAQYGTAPWTPSDGCTG